MGRVGEGRALGRALVTSPALSSSHRRYLCLHSAFDLIGRSHSAIGNISIPRGHWKMADDPKSKFGSGASEGGEWKEGGKVGDKSAGMASSGADGAGGCIDEGGRRGVCRLNRAVGLGLGLGRCPCKGGQEPWPSLSLPTQLVPRGPQQQRPSKGAETVEGDGGCRSPHSPLLRQSDVGQPPGFRALG